MKFSHIIPILVGACRIGFGLATGLQVFCAQTVNSPQGSVHHQQGLAAFRGGNLNGAIQHLKRAVEL